MDIFVILMLGGLIYVAGVLTTLIIVKPKRCPDCQNEFFVSKFRKEMEEEKAKRGTNRL